MDDEVNADGGESGRDQAPRRRRRAAGRPAGPPQAHPPAEQSAPPSEQQAAGPVEGPAGADSDESATTADEAQLAIEEPTAAQPAAEPAPEEQSAAEPAAETEQPAEEQPAAEESPRPPAALPTFQAPELTAATEHKSLTASSPDRGDVPARRSVELPGVAATDPFHVGSVGGPTEEEDEASFELDEDEEITATAFFLAPEIELEEVDTEPPLRRGKQRKGKPKSEQAGSEQADQQSGEDAESEGEAEEVEESGKGAESAGSKRRRRRRRRASAEESDDEETGKDEVSAVKGSTRLEAKRQRRREGRDAGRRRSPIVSEAEFLARRESVERVMVVRGMEDRTQVAVLEDGILVEHYVTRERNASMIGNVYLGKVQNVLPSMEAAFVDIGRGRNAVLYAGEVNWQEAGLEGQPKRIELALQPGDSVLVQVTKDPVGHKGARLTSQISLPGRYLVYVPNGRMTGISRKLPDKERARLKKALRAALPEDAGVIVRTAAEGATEEQLASDVARLAAQWESISEKTQSAKAPSLLYSEPDLAIRVVRDIFNEDFSELIVSGTHAQDMIEEYVGWVAPELTDRVKRWTKSEDLFAAHRIDEQITKALDRKVMLPSGGSLVIDRTEAMTVVDVNTGRFVGQGGNLEETVTRNNLEAAEEIVRQLRLRDIGGIIVVDFIDMVLESNRDLVVRRLVECLGRDRTKHQVAEITSLGLVQMTRKRLGQGLLETFSETCEHCNGRGVRVQSEPVGSRRRRPPGPIPGAPTKPKGQQQDATPDGSDSAAPADASVPDAESGADAEQAEPQKV